jgi:hypothetical protein
MYMFQLAQEWKSHKPLDKLSNHILKYFIDSPQSSYRCHSYLKKEYERHHKKISYKRVNDRVSELHLVGLIKEKRLPEGQKSKNNAKYFELTSLGIFYIFRNGLNRSNINIITNHQHNGLYNEFIYPYLAYKTISKITDDRIIREILSYISRCCSYLARELIFLK